MPELPEVATTVQGLRDTIINKTIIDAFCDLARPNYPNPTSIKCLAYWNTLKSAIIGTSICSVRRIGKHILIDLSSGQILCIHMRMTGHLLYGNFVRRTDTKGTTTWEGDTPALNDPTNRFIHMVCMFGDGTALALCDARQFATIILLDGLEDQVTYCRGVGIDALDQGLTLDVFTGLYERAPNSLIKTFLLNQKHIAGIGNIYADELLCRAGIHPQSSIKHIPAQYMQLLWTHIGPLLRQGIALGGDSTSDYRNIYGQTGSFHGTHLAYQRTGKPCAMHGCNGTIQRITLGGRGTHVCDTHQKLYTGESSRTPNR